MSMGWAILLLVMHSLLYPHPTQMVVRNLTIIRIVSHLTHLGFSGKNAQSCLLFVHGIKKNPREKKGVLGPVFSTQNLKH